jgi:8-oxo-dGTP pyrophosphatase MutT (NUDIX family)
MNRQHILQQLHAHNPADDHERAMRDAIITFVQTYENCAARALLAGHLTGSAWIVDEDLTHALLTHHRKLDLWVQLGGHVEEDADMLNAAWREAREESGLADVRCLSEHIFDVDVHAIPARPGEPEHFHYDIRFLLQADRHAPLVVSRESKELAWLTLAEIERLTQEESVLRMVRKTSTLPKQIANGTVPRA